MSDLEMYLDKTVYLCVSHRYKGYTNEGKELLLAIVSAPQNMNRIDEIRKNNLRLSGLLNDKSADINMPTVFNVVTQYFDPTMIELFNDTSWITRKHNKL